MLLRVGKKLDSLQEKIVQLLEGVNKSMSALEIAHAVGLKVRREVNPDLYALQKKGLVSMQHDQGPPLWRSAGNHQQIPSQPSSQPTSQQPSQLPLHQSSHLPSVTLGRGRGRGRGLSSLAGERSEGFLSTVPPSQFTTDLPGSIDCDVDHQVIQVL